MKAGLESGPVALSVFKSLCTHFQSILISGMFGVVLAFVWYVSEIFLCKYRLELLIENVGSRLCVLCRKPSLFFSGATPVNSCPLLFTNDQKFLELSLLSLLAVSCM